MTYSHDPYPTLPEMLHDWTDTALKADTILKEVPMPQSRRDEAIARVHVDDYEPEVHTGERALEWALIAADTYRRDFPGAVVGVSYNPRAAEERRRETLARLGATEQTKEDR